MKPTTYMRGGVRIYSTLRIPNNFPKMVHYHFLSPCQHFRWRKIKSKIVDKGENGPQPTLSPHNFLSHQRMINGNPFMFFFSSIYFSSSLKSHNKTYKACELISRFDFFFFFFFEWAFIFFRKWLEISILLPEFLPSP